MTMRKRLRDSLVRLVSESVASVISTEKVKAALLPYFQTLYSRSKQMADIIQTFSDQLDQLTQDATDTNARVAQSLDQLNKVIGDLQAQIATLQAGEAAKLQPLLDKVSHARDILKQIDPLVVPTAPTAAPATPDTTTTAPAAPVDTAPVTVTPVATPEVATPAPATTDTTVTTPAA